MVLVTRFQLEREPPEKVTSDSSKFRTTSERVKVMVDVSPTLRELSSSSSVMAMVGAMVSKSKFCAVVSITMALLSARELVDPGVTNLGFALFAAPVLAFIVPPLRASAEVPVKSRSLELSPSCTVYVKLSVVVPDPEE